jgi:hypothetical protein
MLSSRFLPSSPGGTPGWSRTLTRRAIARYHRDKHRREEREAPTELVDEMVDATTEVGWAVDGVMIRPWLEEQVAGNDRDEELFDILIGKAQTGATYEALAAAHGMALPALTSRIFQFKKKYGPRYKRYRERAMLLILVGGAALLALMIALVLWIVRGHGLQREHPPPHAVTPQQVPPVPSLVAPDDPNGGVASPPPR